MRYEWNAYADMWRFISVCNEKTSKTSKFYEYECGTKINDIVSSRSPPRL